MQPINVHLFETYEFDDDGEATGIVHFWCARCRPNDAEPESSGACEGTICEGCGLLLLPPPEEPYVTCKQCHVNTPAATAHLHGNLWVGECCWDERLRTTA